MIVASGLSGYDHGGLRNTIIPTQGLAGNVRKLQDYCLRNPKTPVMEAVDALFGTNK